MKRMKRRKKMEKKERKQVVESSGNKIKECKRAGTLQTSP